MNTFFKRSTTKKTMV